MVVMGSRTVSLDDEAYERLESRRRDDESYSDMVKRLAEERSWHEVASLLSDDAVDEIEDAVASGRRRSRDRRERVSRRLDNLSC